MRLFITRHGKVSSNEKKLYNGVTCEPLTQEGIRQAKKLSKRLEKEHIEKIVSSSTKRAVQTAEIINQSLNKNIIIENNLKEINFGIFENKSFEYIKKNYRKIYEKRKKNKFKFRIPQGESYEDIFKRVKPIVLNLINNKKTGIVVTHATVIKVLLTWLTGKSLDEIEKSTYHNTCLFEFEVKIHNKEIKCEPKIYNSIVHLSE
ncbi:MAG: histidine phosphatase family protein [Nanobdellota archaeon]